jgi:hypothetical protein
MIQDLYELPISLRALARFPDWGTGHLVAVRNTGRADAKFQAPI